MKVTLSSREDLLYKFTCLASVIFNIIFLQVWANDSSSQIEKDEYS